MSLVDSEADDRALLELEDAAIRDQDKDEVVATIPTGDELAKLIEGLNSVPSTRANRSG